MHDTHDTHDTHGMHYTHDLHYMHYMHNTPPHKHFISTTPHCMSGFISMAPHCVSGFISTAPPLRERFNSVYCQGCGKAAIAAMMLFVALAVSLLTRPGAQTAS